MNKQKMYDKDGNCVGTISLSKLKGMGADISLTIQKANEKGMYTKYQIAQMTQMKRNKTHE